METNKQNPDFVGIGIKLIQWFEKYGRNLPFRQEPTPYNIWISEVIFQQTRIQQGMQHYLRFIERFPTLNELAKATEDEVLLYWKGLGYYSRAINLHKAAQQIINNFSGDFPRTYPQILSLKGIGKYTASAIASMAFGLPYPAIDGNLYRVLSRFFADDYDISHSKAYEYFTTLALRMMPPDNAGTFNQAMMDLGSEICKPKNPLCPTCPISNDCTSYQLGKVEHFPVKKKKITKVSETMDYFFISDGTRFLVKQRGKDSIWKSLYEFPNHLPDTDELPISKHSETKHILTHKILNIKFFNIKISEGLLSKYANLFDCQCIYFDEMEAYAFPKPLQNFLLEVRDEVGSE